MILGILQARLSSTRLPGKVLLPLLSQPMIVRQVERLKYSKLMDELVLATSNDESDSPLVDICKNNAITCYRGDLKDVLSRFYGAARLYNPDHIVRLTGDCPLTDPSVIDEVIRYHLNGNFDYTSNTLEPTFPDGLDIEVFRYSCLIDAQRNATLPSEREHVTPYIINHRDYKKGSYKAEADLSAYRWTVDEHADFELVEHIYSALYKEGSVFTTSQILQYLEEHSELKDYNTVYKRNEGYLKSLAKDTFKLE